MLGRRVFRALQSDLEVVVLTRKVRELTDRLDVLPIAGVHGIFRALDRRKSVLCTEADMNLHSLERGVQIVDSWGRGIDLETTALARRAESVSRRMRRRIRRHDLDGVTAIGKQAGVERIRLVAQIVLQ